MKAFMCAALAWDGLRKRPDFQPATLAPSPGLYSARRLCALRLKWAPTSYFGSRARNSKAFPPTSVCMSVLSPKSLKLGPHGMQMSVWLLRSDRSQSEPLRAICKTRNRRFGRGSASMNVVSAARTRGREALASSAAASATSWVASVDAGPLCTARTVRHETSATRQAVARMLHILTRGPRRVVGERFRAGGTKRKYHGPGGVGGGAVFRRRPPSWRGGRGAARRHRRRDR
mmetsp:Transcript_18241/g.56978  ORF Transcript_18241/g.56978 Transcript_18241/m.56978 type:complete len:231 (+) Transcript_18241:545-1237(+)